MTDLRLLALDDGLPTITPEEAVYVASLTDGSSASLGPEADTDATPDAIEAHEPAVAPVEPPGTFYVGEWRGGPLYRCPECWFNARSDERVAEHVLVVHTPPEAPSLAERAARAGIVIAR